MCLAQGHNVVTSVRLGRFVIFQGIQTSIAKNPYIPYINVIFQGWEGLSRPPVPHLDPCVLNINSSH